MNINSGIIWVERGQMVTSGGNSLWLYSEDFGPTILADRMEDIRYLAASKYGEYLAFWSITGESFRLVDASGDWMWSGWMNTDKATPYGIRFSDSGDALACLYDFEGVPGMFFCDIGKQYSTMFGCSGSPIGFDANLQYFVIDNCDPYEDERLAFYEKRDGGKVAIPPDVLKERMKQSPLIVDRERCLYASTVLSMRGWESLCVLNGMGGFVVLKDRNLYWLAKDATVPDVTINDCVPPAGKYEWFFRTVVTASGNLALVQSMAYEKAFLVNRNQGVVWRGNGLSSAEIKGERVLAQYNDGTIEVVRGNGSVELKCDLSRGYGMEAVDIADDILYVACIPQYGRRFEIKKFNLK